MDGAERQAVMETLPQRMQDAGLAPADTKLK
jgi:predicted Fe-S protein YdhL (DUF1289 family)